MGEAVEGTGAAAAGVGAGEVGAAGPATPAAVTPSGAVTLSGAAAPAAAPRVGTRSPLREVLALPAYRRFWVSQFLCAVVAGTLRFTFIWLVLELTDWPPAAGVLGVALGVPALALSLPAGALSDRTDRRLLVVRGAVAAAALLVVTAALVRAELVTVPVAAVLALAVSAMLALITPALQAMVPSLVPRERLMSGVALQNIGMQLAQFAGYLVGGVAIAVAGTAGAFAVLAGCQALAAGAMWRVTLPPRPAGAAGSRAAAGGGRRGRGEVADGIRFVLATEPLRSLVAVSLLIGLAISVFMVNLPEVARDDLGRDALGTSLLFGALALGMMSTSLWLASRRDTRRLGLKVMGSIGFALGPGVLLAGLSDSYALTLAVMAAWGMSGGVAVASQRTLLQQHTPDHMMGRVMGANTLGLQGAFPLGALATTVLVPALGADGVMVAGGATVAAIALPLTARRAVRRA